MNRSELSRRLLCRVAWLACLALALTAVHHVYGAYVYDTPWRLHAAIVSAIVGFAIAGALLVVRRREDDRVGAVAFWVLVAATLLVPVLGVGLFEGWYNHVLKNAMYFGGAPSVLLNRLFPAPTYELPDNLFFEATGVLQAVAGSLAGWTLYRLVRVRFAQSLLAKDAAIAHYRPSHLTDSDALYGDK